MAWDHVLAVRDWELETTSAKLVAYTLATHANRSGLAWPSTATLCRETGCAPRTVRKAIADLVDTGRIWVEHRVGQVSQFHFPGPVDNVVPLGVPPAESAGVPRHAEHPPPGTLVTDPRHSRHPRKSNERTNELAPAISTDDDPPAIRAGDRLGGEAPTVAEGGRLTGDALAAKLATFRSGLRPKDHRRR